MKRCGSICALFALVSALVVSSGCAKKTADPTPPPPVAHEHKAPHGGTPVVLGQEAYHVEFVRDPAAGILQAFIFDGELEDFVRISAPSFEVTATVDGHPQTLQFTAVANPATGETVGDTALFEAHADWLKRTPAFDALLKEITIRGAAFTAVKFNFPRGNESR